MASSSRNQLHEPKSLGSLACGLKYPYGNYLIHQFVLNNFKPSNSCSESDIRAALRSFPGDRVNDMNKEGFTALHLAVITQNRFMVQMLLSSLTTVDVDARWEKGNGGSALHLAVTEDYFDRAFSNAHIYYYRAIRDTAVKEESLEKLKASGECGASVDVINNDGVAPLRIANRIEILELLITKGADVNAKDFRGRTPLYVALRNKCLEAVEILVDGGASVTASAWTNDLWTWDVTALHVAAENNQVDVVKLLIRKGADLNARNSMGRSPLYCAVAFGHLETVRVLLENDADVDSVDVCGNTALHLAVDHNRIDMLEILIRKGADVNAKDLYGRTPLHTAVLYGQSAAVKILVDSGAALDPVDKYNDTALAIAERGNRIEIIKYLNSRLADVSAVDAITVPEGECIDEANIGQPPSKKQRRD